jgi:autotransporter-associated beta strand protein
LTGSSAASSGGLEKLGAGTLTLSGNNAYTGGTLISAGTLRLNNASAAGTGTITQSSGSALQINTGGTVANAMDFYNLQTLQTVTLSGQKTLRNATYDIASDTTTTESGALTGPGGITKQGLGTLVLAGSTNNTFAGATVVEAGRLVLSNAEGNAIDNSSSITIKSGAALVLGASNQIGDGIGLVLDGGTFIVGTATAGYSETLGTLTLNANSTIDLGSYAVGLRQLTFANSSSISWATNVVLTITNWQGMTRASSDVAEILFGTGGLTSTQLGQIYFANQNIDGGVLIGGSGELAPIPEAPVVWGAAALAAFVLWRERRRLRSVVGRSLPKSRLTSPPAGQRLN